MVFFRESDPLGVTRQSRGTVPDKEAGGFFLREANVHFKLLDLAGSDCLTSIYLFFQIHNVESAIFLIPLSGIREDLLTLELIPREINYIRT